MIYRKGKHISAVTREPASPEVPVAAPSLSCPVRSNHSAPSDSRLRGLFQQLGCLRAYHPRGAAEEVSGVRRQITIVTDPKASTFWTSPSAFYLSEHYRLLVAGT